MIESALKEAPKKGTKVFYWSMSVDIINTVNFNNRPICHNLLKYRRLFLTIDGALNERKRYIENLK